MRVNGKNYHAVWMRENTVRMVDQLALPFRFRIKKSDSWEESAQAISDMTVRGAGTIGATAAFAVLQALLASSQKNYVKNCTHAVREIKKTRPTANDLFYAADSMLEEINKSSSFSGARQNAEKKARWIFESYLESGEKIGLHGNALLRKNACVLTHCNAGWLALVDWGSATAPIYAASRTGKKPFVFVDETRPRLQGAKLTAWELAQEKIAHCVIADNAAGHFMQKGEIDIVITGADRIAMNGDTANKIGTYEKSVLARENGIPFYIAAPLSTFDTHTESGKEIIIEERSQSEVLRVFGRGKHHTGEVEIYSKKSPAKNPAFDVTPAKYITGFITPKGIIKPKESEIRGLFK
ncbi:MAG: S-methyl-5-thioribose-1-phosphate isomerase [Candidatus Diapherotrites archaeon]|nr:S-methyl-5-thioribose-1-phosphate isomerase [Candidatus Diapherotrites archaeon]